MSRSAFAALAALGLAVGAGCGGSSGPSGPAPTPTPPNNSVPVRIDGGPVPGQNFFNLPDTSVTLCVPGTSDCQTIDGIEVDTGSSGLRIVASAVTLSLPHALGTGGHPLAECLQFVNSSTWGAVRTADVQLAGETAHAIPVQIIGDHSVGKVPSACTSGGFPATNTAADLGANGVLGVGNYLADCGPACAASGASNPGQYYECGPPEGCRVTAVDESNQVSHPVASFAADNNGVVLEFPAVTVETRSLTGTMRFGIGTQANNALGDAKVFTFDRLGFLTAKYRGASLPFSFVDSGSAVFYFPDQDIPTCTDFEGLYCPQSDLKRSVTMLGANGASRGIGFTVGDADVLLTHRNSVFATVCSTSLLPGATDLVGPSSFDWGLPFYFGRTVFTAIEGKPTPGGAGPYVAYTP